jgi:hypothetical protein
MDGLPHLPTWLPISEAFKIAIRKLGNKKYANKQLLHALQAGKIRNGGILENNPDTIAYRKIHVNTDDFMKWLATVERPQ